MILEGEWRMPEAPLFFVRMCINKRLNTDQLPSCAGRGSRGLADYLEKLIADERLPVEIKRGPCMNNCLIGPNLKIQGGALINLKDDISEPRVEEIMALLRAEVAKRKAAAAALPSS